VFPEEVGSGSGRDVGTSGSGGSGSGGSATVAGSSSAGSPQDRELWSATVVGSSTAGSPLDRELGSAEVRDWATRVDSRGNGVQEAAQEPAWDLKHVGGG
jgi:hypothetical protein